MIRANHPPIEAEFDYCGHGAKPEPLRLRAISLAAGKARIKLTTNIASCSTIILFTEIPRTGDPK